MFEGSAVWEQVLVWSCVWTDHGKKSGIQPTSPPLYLLPIPSLVLHPSSPWFSPASSCLYLFSIQPIISSPPSFSFVPSPLLVFATLLFLGFDGVQAMECCWQHRPASSSGIPMLDHCGWDWASGGHSQGSELGSFHKSLAFSTCNQDSFSAALFFLVPRPLRISFQQTNNTMVLLEHIVGDTESHLCSFFTINGIGECPSLLHLNLNPILNVKMPRAPPSPSHFITYNLFNIL